MRDIWIDQKHFKANVDIYYTLDFNNRDTKEGEVIIYLGVICENDINFLHGIMNNRFLIEMEKKFIRQLSTTGN